MDLDPRADLMISARLRIPASELTWTFARSGGPGGQNVNKVNSKAVLRWPAAQSVSLPEDVRTRFLAAFSSRLTNEGALVLSSDEHRDQPQNMLACLEKLAAMIRQVAVAPKKRRPTKPSAGAQRRRLESKQHQSRKKQDRRISHD